ncbi:MAG: CbiQ family ECF transporter T component, partial [Eubacteriales bacterium]
MLKDITLGQFFPGNSPIHRMDPRTKLLVVAVYVASLFTATNWVGYAVNFVFLAVAIMASKLKWSVILKGLKPLFFIITFTALLNLFYTPGQVLVEFWILSITKEGITTAIFMVIRIMLLITGTLILTYTTSPITLTDGLERLMNPLKKIRVPVHELAMMMSIALRFIPTL